MSSRLIGSITQNMKTMTAGLVMLGALLAPAATVVDLNLNLSGDVAEMLKT